MPAKFSFNFGNVNLTTYWMYQAVQSVYKTEFIWNWTLSFSNQLLKIAQNGQIFVSTFHRDLNILISLGLNLQNVKTNVEYIFFKF